MTKTDKLSRCDYTPNIEQTLMLQGIFMLKYNLEFKGQTFRESSSYNYMIRKIKSKYKTNSGIGEAAQTMWERIGTKQHIFSKFES